MSNYNKNSTSGGISFGGALGIVFIVLKLCKVIDWSWWLILLPIYAPIVIGALLIMVACILKHHA